MKTLEKLTENMNLAEYEVEVLAEFVAEAWILGRRRGKPADAWTRVEGLAKAWHKYKKANEAYKNELNKVIK